MELQQMRYAVAVADERSFTRAAQRCFVVQSALSHQIKVLEAELGVALFARTSRRVEVTAAGHAFVAAARTSLTAAERAAVDAAAAAGHVRGRLSVGAIPTVTAVDVPAALGTFHRAHPDVKIGFQVSGSVELEAGIGQGHIDVAVLGLPRSREPRGVAWRLLARDRHVLVVSAQHPLADRAQVELADLAGEVFVDFPAGGPGRAQTDLAFAAAGVERDVAFEALPTDLMLGLVRQNLAITLLTSRYAPEDPAFATIPITDGPVRDEYLAWNDLNPSPAARAFLAHLEPGRSAM